MVNHRGARTGGAHDEIGVALFEYLYEVCGDATRFSAISGVECGLATASLPFVELDFAARAAQNIDGARADAGPHLIDETGYKQSYFNWRFVIADFGHCQFPIADCRSGTM
jgi:hypothetical protein